MILVIVFEYLITQHIVNVLTFQNRRLREQLKRSEQKINVSIHNDIDGEDVMMMKVKTFLKLHKFVQQDRKCKICGKNRSRSILERNDGQYQLHFMCDSCYSKTTWVNSQDWTQPGLIRKFAESMTVSGINY